MCTIFILCKCNIHVQFLYRVENAAVQVEWHPTNPILAMRKFYSFPSLFASVDWPCLAPQCAKQEQGKCNTSVICSCRWQCGGGNKGKKTTGMGQTATEAADDNKKDGGSDDDNEDEDDYGGGGGRGKQQQQYQ